MGEGLRPVREGEGPDGYDEFVRTGAPVLWRLAYARTGERTVAEDLVQDVLADAYRRWDRIGAYDEPLAWARRAVLNRAISRWRSHDREARAMLRLAGRRNPTVTGEPVFSDTELWGCLRALPDRQFQVALLLWFEELTVDETAVVMGCGPETVRTHWRRARQRLAASLGEDDDAPTAPPAPAGDRRTTERGGQR